MGSAVAPASGADEQVQATDATEIDAQMRIVQARYGSYLQDSEMPLIRRGLERNRRSAEEILKVSIHNGDAPDCLFHPDGL